MALKQTEAMALWCLGERGDLHFTELQEHTGTDGRRLRKAVQGLMRKRLVRPAADADPEAPPEQLCLTRRGRCVYDLLRTLESHTAAA